LTDSTQLKRWHTELVGAYEALMKLSNEGLGGAWPAGISNDSVMAIGQAAGIVSKAKALIGRDIDDAKPAEPVDTSLTRSGFA
jgi:hypothetical protein